MSLLDCQSDRCGTFPAPATLEGKRVAARGVGLDGAAHGHAAPDHHARGRLLDPRHESMHPAPPPVITPSAIIATPARTFTMRAPYAGGCGADIGSSANGRRYRPATSNDPSTSFARASLAVTFSSHSAYDSATTRRGRALAL